MHLLSWVEDRFPVRFVDGAEQKVHPAIAEGGDAVHSGAVDHLRAEDPVVVEDARDVQPVRADAEAKHSEGLCTLRVSFDLLEADQIVEQLGGCRADLVERERREDLLELRVVGVVEGCGFGCECCVTLPCQVELESLSARTDLRRQPQADEADRPNLRCSLRAF